MTLRSIAAWIVALALVATACSSDADDASPSPTNEAAPSTTESLPDTTDSQPDTTEVATTEAPTTTEIFVAPDVPATTPLPEGEPPLPPSKPGEYNVGRQSLQILDDVRFRSLPVDVWYPTDATTGEPAIYTFIPGVSLPSDAAFQDAPLAPGGPFPVVVYSHGSGGQSYIASFFTEALASHGFVVIAPNHVGNTATEVLFGLGDEPEIVAYNRPADTAFVISEMLDRSADPESPFFDFMDAERIGMAGHSFGGFTAYAAAGGLPATSDDVTAVPVDDRIDAIVAMAPVTSFLPENVLASITIPTMVITGTDDQTTPIDPESTQAFEQVSSGYAYRVDLDGAAHQSFTDVCDYQQKLPSIEGIPAQFVEVIDEFALSGCQPEQMPFERATELTNQYVISFFLAHLAGDESYRLLLTPEYAAGDADVEFFTR